MGGPLPLKTLNAQPTSQATPLNVVVCAPFLFSVRTLKAIVEDDSSQYIVVSDTDDRESDSEDGQGPHTAFSVPDDSPPRPARRLRSQVLGCENLVKLRHIVGHPLDCVSGVASPLTHLAAFIRLECPHGVLRRFTGMADVAAERILKIHEGAAPAMAPVPDGTFRKSRLPGPPLAAAMLEEVLAHVKSRFKRMAYAVRVLPEDLYLGEEQQPPQCDHHPIAKVYICRICFNPKSHPVIFKSCSHSVCYVCARLAFNDSFECPICGAIQYEPPLPAVKEQEAIEQAILPQVDWTRFRVVEVPTMNGGDSHV
ncbi:hypothetical protein C8F01DRAFT_1260214 [Mycena amicta]|nr:hypothetical protein C8F01DRAFT_1260214 [Mycena amicta]